VPGLFKLTTEFQPRGPAGGDPEAGRGAVAGTKHQVLLGVTGSGKDLTMAEVIEAIDRRPLVLLHNKTLAAQLYRSSAASSPGTLSNTSCPTTTTTSRRPTSRRATPTSRRNRRSTTRSTGCVTRPRGPCSSGAASSSSHRSRASTGLGFSERTTG